MIRRNILLIIFLLAYIMISVPVKAQMTDDAVVAYVKDGMESGKSQQDLAKELLAKGVTQAQVERIRAQYTQDGKQSSTDVKIAGAQERQRRMSKTPFINEDTAFDKLTIETEETDIDEVYGRNIFKANDLTFAPSANLPTPVNYILGPEDEVIIDIWGVNQVTIRQIISPDGTINIPDFGPIALNGMTIKQAEAYMKRKLSQIYSVDGEDAKSEIKLTLGSIRTIQVHLMGEVAVPGTYFISSLSNIYHALHSAGGVSDLGSLRDIQLIRHGKTIAVIDIYDFIRNGKMNDMILEEGDIINVPTYDIIVNVEGKVKRPMSYEMKSGETVSNLIDYASGFSGDAYTKNIRLTRKNGKEYQIFTVLEPDYDTFCLMEGDSISVGAMLDRYENKIEIKGAVYRPGIYELCEQVNTVKELIERADGLKGDAFTNRGIITREREDLTLELVPIDIGAIMSGRIQDIELAKNDILYIPSIHDLNDIGNIKIIGEVANPGTYVYAENTTLEDAIMLAGGLLESASTAKIDVSRRIKNPSSTTPTDEVGQLFTFSFKDGYIIDGDSGFKLQPYDQIVVRKSPGYEEQRFVRVTGEVAFPGTYVMTKKEERLSDLIAKSGGLTKWAYVKGARLERTIVSEEKARMESTVDILESAKDSINMEKLEIESKYFVGIDLHTALVRPGSDADLVLREGDVLTVPEYINTVKISGNVMYPNVVTYNPKMTVNDYVMMAGGYGHRSKKSKAYVIYLNGTLAKARRHALYIVEPGCEIVIPQKKDKGDNLQEFLSIATTTSSIATMMATIANIIK